MASRNALPDTGLDALQGIGNLRSERTAVIERNGELLCRCLKDLELLSHIGLPGRLRRQFQLLDDTGGFVESRLSFVERGHCRGSGGGESGIAWIRRRGGGGLVARLPAIAQKPVPTRMERRTGRGKDIDERR